MSSHSMVGRGRLGALMRLTIGLTAAVCVLALWAVALAGSASAATPCGAGGVFSQSGAGATCTYAYTGSEDTFTVPAGVGSVGVTAVGAPGGSATCGFGSCGGAGAVVTATVALPVGTNTLYVEVGGSGQAGSGGFNGGGSSPGGGGGGASDVRTLSSDDPASLSSRLVVGGGGGGGPLNPSCVAFGGAAGETSVTGPGDGGASDGCSDGGNGGFGGTAGGDGGTGDVVGGVDCTGGSGSLGPGGDFLAPPCTKGGGGGGGYYGGGAGGGSESGAGGGGGGSSFWVSGATGTSLSQNTSNTAPASVTITFVFPGPTSKADCKNGGWRTFGDMFKNQGECVTLFDTD